MVKFSIYLNRRVFVMTHVDLIMILDAHVRSYVFSRCSSNIGTAILGCVKRDVRGYSENIANIPFSCNNVF